MNTYIFEHTGVYLGAYTVVQAANLGAATREALDVIAEKKSLEFEKCHNPEDLMLAWDSEHDSGKVIWDGDY